MRSTSLFKKTAPAILFKKDLSENPSNERKDAR